MGKGVQVYFGFVELVVVCVFFGKIFIVEEYLAIVFEKVVLFEGEFYCYFNFNEIDNFEDFG